MFVQPGLVRIIYLPCRYYLPCRNPKDNTFEKELQEINYTKEKISIKYDITFKNEFGIQDIPNNSPENEEIKIELIDEGYNEDGTVQCFEYHLHDLIIFFLLINSSPNKYCDDPSKWWESALIDVEKLKIKKAFGDCKVFNAFYENKNDLAVFPKLQLFKSKYYYDYRDIEVNKASCFFYNLGDDLYVQLLIKNQTQKAMSFLNEISYEKYHIFKLDMINKQFKSIDDEFSERIGKIEKFQHKYRYGNLTSAYSKGELSELREYLNSLNILVKELTNYADNLIGNFEQLGKKVLNGNISLIHKKDMVYYKSQVGYALEKSKDYTSRVEKIPINDYLREINAAISTLEESEGIDTDKLFIERSINNKNLIGCMHKAKKHCMPYLDFLHTYVPASTYTSHSSGHTNRIHDNILRFHKFITFNEYELYLLYMGAWFHDIGMCVFEEDGPIEKIDFNKDIRSKHASRSAMYVKRNYESKISPAVLNNEINFVSTLCESHSSKYPIDSLKIDHEASIDGKKYDVRLPLLASILRLSDACDAGSERVPSGQTIQGGGAPVEQKKISEKHHYKNLILSQLQINSHSQGKLTIDLDFGIDNKWILNHSIESIDEIIDEAKDEIYREINGEVNSVLEVMKRYSFDISVDACNYQSDINL